jgi:manganese-dependent ADP-ribose/CDP-alcohol diphosphatase
VHNVKQKLTDIRFGVITDIHFGNSEDPEVKKRDLRRCFDFWKDKQVDFAIQLGDLIEGKVPEAEKNLDDATAFLVEYSGTFHHVVGNNCLGIVSLDRYLERTSLDSPYYSFSSHGIRFIVLHGMDIKPETKPSNSTDISRKELLHKDPWANLYCGAIGGRQLHWLVGQLDEAKASGESAVIFCHFPLLKQTSDKPHGLLWNHDEVTDILRRNENIIACFTGHLHREAYFKRYGIHFMTFPGFVRRSEPHHYACCIVEIGERSVIVRDHEMNTIHELPID